MPAVQIVRRAHTSDDREERQKIDRRPGVVGTLEEGDGVRGPVRHRFLAGVRLPVRIGLKIAVQELTGVFPSEIPL